MQHSPVDERPRRKRSALGEDLAKRTAHAFKQARHQTELDLIKMKELAAKVWELAKVQVQQAADDQKTEFTWTFKYANEFKELRPDIVTMRSALPDELTEFHHDLRQGNCINIGHDKIACEFNIRLYWSPRAHEILQHWDKQNAMSAASLQKAGEEAARLGQF
jgi:hypothetical protein